MNEIVLKIARVCLASYNDDAKMRDIMHVLADHGYIPVAAYRAKAAEVDERLKADIKTIIHDAAQKVEG